MGIIIINHWFGSTQIFRRPLLGLTSWYKYVCLYVCPSLSLSLSLDVYLKTLIPDYLLKDLDYTWRICSGVNFVSVALFENCQSSSLIYAPLDQGKAQWSKAKQVTVLSKCWTKYLTKFLDLRPYFHKLSDQKLDKK